MHHCPLKCVNNLSKKSGNDIFSWKLSSSCKACKAKMHKSMNMCQVTLLKKLTCGILFKIFVSALYKVFYYQEKVSKGKNKIIRDLYREIFGNASPLHSCFVFPLWNLQFQFIMSWCALKMIRIPSISILYE